MQHTLKRALKITMYGLLATVVFVVSFFSSGNRFGALGAFRTAATPHAYADVPAGEGGDGSGASGDGGSGGGEGEGGGDGSGGEGGGGEGGDGGGN